MAQWIKAQGQVKAAKNPHLWRSPQKNTENVKCFFRYRLQDFLNPQRD